MKIRKTKQPKPHMRVNAGRAKGKLIECPPGEIRPMTSKVKEALFNIIGNCRGLTMLDLFTGSGNISIEAYSRGLEEADIIEMDWGKKKIIQNNLDHVGFKGARLIISEAITYCRSCTKKYDFIMCDPPFRWEKKEELLRIIGERELLNNKGFLVIHLPKKEDLPEEIAGLSQYDVRKYGLNMLLFYCYTSELDKEEQEE